MFNNANPDARNLSAIREEMNERKSVVQRGDIVAALRAQADAPRIYREMADALNAWTKSMREYENNRRAAEIQLKSFAKSTESLFCGSMRVIMLELDTEITKDDVTITSDDDRWTTFLMRLSKADTLNALKMTHAAHKVAVETLAGFEVKAIGLKQRLSMRDGSTDAEIETARKLLIRCNLAIEILRERKSVIVTANLRLRDTLSKFLTRYSTKDDANRQLTDAEKEILKGLI